MKSYRRGIVNVSVVFMMLSVLYGCAGKDDWLRESGLAQDTYYADAGETEDSGGDGSFADDSFTGEEYAKLLALQFDGYEDMTVSEFQNRVWEYADTQENRDLLERFAHSEALYELRDTDETASFLFYILVPLTAEKWQSRDYGGYATSDFPYREDNATLEYYFTLTILDADTLTVGTYNNVRLEVENGMRSILNGKTKDELRDEAAMLDTIQAETDRLTKRLQTEELEITISDDYYQFVPVMETEEENEKESVQDAPEEEKRQFPNGTEEDYRALLALKTPDYQDMPLADFNLALLEWANEDYERMERISEDTAWNDFRATLTGEELHFVKSTVLWSGGENAEYVQSYYTGRAEENPVLDEYLSRKIAGEEGNVWCSLYYQFTYSISDKNEVTVGERDRAVAGMIDAVRSFWENMELEEIMKIEERDAVEVLKDAAEKSGTDHIVFTVREDHVQFEKTLDF